MSDTSYEQQESNINTHLWESVQTTDPTYTKPFKRGGGFSGTAINATYLAKKATEYFGPMGIGWGVSIIEETYIDGVPLDEHGTKEKIHKILAEVWYSHPHMKDNEGKPLLGRVQQFGQTTYITKNRYGIYSDEEHAKKSLTDAMTKALSLLGFAGDVHLGLYDDNKYVHDLRQQSHDAQQQSAEKKVEKITSEQVDELTDLLEQTNTDYKQFLNFFRINSLPDMPADSYKRAKAALCKKAAKS